MKRRQTSVQHQWLITDQRLGADLLAVIRRLPRGSGVLVRHHDLPARERRRLLQRIRRLAWLRGLEVVDEAEGEMARVHNAAEIRQARLGRASVLLLSPIFATSSHPQWRPLPKMRAAALARLAGRPVLALGGMNQRRFRRLKPIGFAGWAGIDAWLEGTRVTGSGSFQAEPVGAWPRI